MAVTQDVEVEAEYHNHIDRSVEPSHRCQEQFPYSLYNHHHHWHQRVSIGQSIASPQFKEGIMCWVTTRGITASFKIWIRSSTGRRENTVNLSRSSFAIVFHENEAILEMNKSELTVGTRGHKRIQYCPWT